MRSRKEYRGPRVKRGESEGRGSCEGNIERGPEKGESEKRDREKREREIQGRGIPVRIRMRRIPEMCQ